MMGFCTASCTTCVAASYLRALSGPYHWKRQDSQLREVVRLDFFDFSFVRVIEAPQPDLGLRPSP